MKTKIIALLTSCAVAVALAGCAAGASSSIGSASIGANVSASPTGGISVGGTGGLLNKSVQFVNADLDNAEAIALANNDTLRAPCYPAVKKWLNGFPGANQGYTISGAASAFEAGAITVNGVQSGVPDSVVIACGPLFLKAQNDALKLFGVLGLSATGL